MKFRKCLALIGLALTATGLWAAGDSDSDDFGRMAEKEMVTDPTNGKVYTAPEYGVTYAEPSLRVLTPTPELRTKGRRCRRREAEHRELGNR